MTLVALDTSVLEAKLLNIDSTIKRHDAKILSLAAASKVASMEARLDRIEEDIDTFSQNLVTLSAAERYHPVTRESGETDQNVSENGPTWEILSTQITTLRKQMRQRAHDMEDIAAKVGTQLSDFSIQLARLPAEWQEIATKPDLHQLSQQVSHEIAEAKTKVMVQCSQLVDAREEKLQAHIARTESTVTEQRETLERQADLLTSLDKFEQHDENIQQLQSQQAHLTTATKVVTNLCSKLQSSNIYRGLDKLASILERKRAHQTRAAFLFWSNIAGPRYSIQQRHSNLSIDYVHERTHEEPLLGQARRVFVSEGLRVLTKCARRRPFYRWWRQGRIQSLLERIIRRKQASHATLIQNSFTRLQCELLDSASRGRSQLFANRLLSVCENQSKSADCGHYIRLIAACLAGTRHQIEKLQEADLATNADTEARLNARAHDILLLVDHNRVGGIQMLNETNRMIQDQIARLSTVTNGQLSDLDCRHVELASNLKATDHIVSQTNTSFGEVSSELSRQMAVIGKLGDRMEHCDTRMRDVVHEAQKAGERISSVEHLMQILSTQVDETMVKQEERWQSLSKGWKELRINVMGVVEAQNRNEDQMQQMQQSLVSARDTATTTHAMLTARIDNLGFEIPPLDVVVEAAIYYEAQALLASGINRMPKEMSDQMGRWAVKAANYIATCADLEMVARLMHAGDEGIDESKAVQQLREGLFKQVDLKICKAVAAAHPNVGLARADARSSFRNYLLEGIDAALSKHEHFYVTGSTRISNVLTNNPKCLACDRPLRTRARAEGAQYITDVLPSDGAIHASAADPPKSKLRPHTAPPKRPRSRPSTADPPRQHSVSIQAFPALMQSTNIARNQDDIEWQDTPIESRRLAASRNHPESSTPA